MKMIPVTAMAIFSATVVRRPTTGLAAVFAVVDTSSIVATVAASLDRAFRFGANSSVGSGASRLLRKVCRYGHTGGTSRFLRRRAGRWRRHPALAAVAPGTPQVSPRPPRARRELAVDDVAAAAAAEWPAPRPRRHGPRDRKSVV